jgi:hypothetical protein
LVACLAQDQLCVTKRNLCHAFRDVATEISCVAFSGERLLLGCAGQQREKVKNHTIVARYPYIQLRIVVYVDNQVHSSHR